jgi:hypothetical protein
VISVHDTGPTSRLARIRAHPLAIVALAVLFLVPVAWLGADSTDESFPEAVSVVGSGTQIVAVESNGSGAEHRRVSADGGLTWRNAAQGETGETAEPTQACAPDKPEHCYRVVPGHLRVEETVNGGASWWIAWSVPDDERNRLGRRYADLGEPAKHLSSRSLAVVAVPGGHAVVVANGRDGYAVRAQDGRWSRTGFGTTVDPTGEKVRPAPPIDGRSARDAAPQMAAGLMAGLMVVAIAGCAAMWRVARWPAMAALALVGVGGLLALAGGFGWRDTNAVLPVLLLVVGLLAALAGAYGVLVLATRRRAVRAVPAVLVGVVGVAVATADAGVFAVWAHGAVGYRSAAYAAQMLAVLALVAAVALVTRWRPTIRGGEIKDTGSDETYAER